METSGSSPKQGPTPGKEIVPYQHAGELAINPAGYEGPVASGQEMVVYGQQAPGSPPALEPPSSYGQEGAVSTQPQAPATRRGSEVAVRHEQQIVPHDGIPVNGSVRPIPREDEGAPGEAGPSLSTAGKRAILESLVKTLGKGLQHGAEGQPQADDSADPEEPPETVIEEPATEELKDDEEPTRRLARTKKATEGRHRRSRKRGSKFGTRELPEEVKEELRKRPLRELWESPSTTGDKQQRQTPQHEAADDDVNDSDQQNPTYIPPQKRQKAAAKPNRAKGKEADEEKEEIIERIIDLFDELESKGNPCSRPVELLRPVNILEKKFKRLRPDEYTRYSGLLNSPKNTTFGNMVRNLPHNWRKADSMTGHVAVDDTIGWAISKKVNPPHSTAQRPSMATSRIITADGQVYDRFATVKGMNGFAVVKREGIPMMKSEEDDSGREVKKPVHIAELSRDDLEMIEKHLEFFSQHP
jgi:hypothetical protein